MQDVSVFVYGLAILMIGFGLAWIFVVIFTDNIGWGVISLWIFPLIYVYVAKNWDRAKIPFLVHLVGIALWIVQINFLPELPSG